MSSAIFVVVTVALTVVAAWYFGSPDEAPRRRRRPEVDRGDGTPQAPNVVPDRVSGHVFRPRPH